MGGRVRVFIASSLDGFIAGPGDDLGWLPAPGEGDGDFGYGAFMADVGALLMGRSTYDVVAGFPEWGYGERPVLVATHRPLEAKRGRVRAVSGDIGALLDQALVAAGGKDVYLDGGVLIRAGLDAERIDELVVSVCPMILGAGAPLFAGTSRHGLVLLASRAYAAGLVQLTYRAVR